MMINNYKAEFYKHFSSFQFILQLWMRSETAKALRPSVTKPGVDALNKLASSSSSNCFMKIWFQ